INFFGPSFRLLVAGVEVRMKLFRERPIRSLDILATGAAREVQHGIQIAHSSLFIQSQALQALSHESAWYLRRLLCFIDWTCECRCQLEPKTRAHDEGIPRQSWQFR